MIEWISVKQFVPDNDNDLITYGSKHDDICFYWPFKSHGEMEQFKWYKTDCNGFAWEVYGITHWSEINTPEEI
jgi:hypothetical protein